MRIIHLAILSALAIAGCGGSKPKQAPPPVDNTKKADPAKTDAPPPAADGDTEAQKRGLVMMGKLGELIAASGSDCGKLGVALKKFVDENKATITEINAEEKKLGEAAMKAFEARHKAEMDKFNAQADSLKKCVGDPGVVEAIQAFEGN